MNKVCSFLRVAGILVMLEGLLFYELPIILALFIVGGLYLFILSTKDLGTLYRHSVALLVVGIILCLVNIIAGVLSILAYDKLDSMKRNGIKAPPVEKEKIDPESRKVDLLLKLGVGMVFIAGVLFATTSWSIITDLIKLIVLVVLALLFLGLSYFAEKHLKIKNTTKMYWLLSMSFFFLAVLGLFYYGAINDYLMYDGEGSEIAYSITAAVLALLSLITAHKFNSNFLRYLGYLAVFASVDSLAVFVGGTTYDITIILYILFFTSMLFIFENTKPIHLFSKYMLYLFPIIVISSIGEVNDYFVIAYAILTSIALFIVSKKGSMADKVIPFILMFIMAIYTIYSFEIPYRELLVITITSLIAIINRLKLIDNSKASILTTSIMQIGLAFILFIIALVNSPLEALLFSIVYLIYVLLSGIDYFKDNSGKIEYFLQPISILYFVMAVLIYLGDTIIDITFLDFAAILTLIYAIMHFISRDKAHKIEYLVFTLSTLVFTTLCNIAYPEVVPNIILLLPTIYLLLYYNNKSNPLRNWAYVILIFVISSLFIAANILSTNNVINGLVLLWIFAMLLLLLYKDKQFRIINYFAVIIPMYSLLLSFQSDIIYFRIVLSILEFYILFLIVHHILPNNLAKNVGAAIGTSLIILQIIFNIGVLMGVYVGIIGIGLIAISYIFKEYSSLFWVGLVTTIINIIFQLQDLWSQLPFWLYLLIGGLSIIGFVTYKELKNKK